MKKLRVFLLLGAAATGLGLALPASSAPASASPAARSSAQSDLPPCLPPHARSAARDLP
jgi:hypothetical protein